MSFCAVSPTVREFLGCLKNVCRVLCSDYFRGLKTSVTDKEEKKFLILTMTEKCGRTQIPSISINV